MSVVLQFSAVALKGFGGEAVSDAFQAGVSLLRRRFADNSRRLEAASHRACARAWRAAEIALAGSSWWDRAKLALASGDQRAFRAQVQAFLAAHPLDGIDGHGPDFRGQCLAQLAAARKAGLLDQGRLDPDELAAQVGDLSRFGDPASALDAEWARLRAAADVLRQHGHAALAAFVELRPASGPPLLAAAVRYFFRREVEADEELARGLAYAQAERLAEGQRHGFAELAEALDRHGDRLEELLGDVLSAVERTRADVLDVKAELLRQGRHASDLASAVLDALAQHQLDRRELRAHDSLSIRDETERRAVKELIRRYRALPADQRESMPALLNAVGKLGVVAGDYESAADDFRHVARLADGPRARAEAAHNLYRAALERRAWPEALEALAEAAALDPGRFAPFPAAKYEPQRILGAGGFGVAFLCRNRHSSAQVVVKTLRRDGLDRDVSEVFREAQALEALEHPAIIRVRDCDYADPEAARPYVVMDYFAGQNLADFVARNGPLSSRELLPLARLVAEALRQAHGKGILHRDVKPANLLVRRATPLPDTPGRGVGSESSPPLPGEPGRGVGGEGFLWEAKLIDFGLAMRADAAHGTRNSTADRTLVGGSIAGTIDYAAPEQLGKADAIVGPYSDVYGFARTCCFALFGTPQPTYQHWQSIPRDLAELLGRCLTEQPRGRPQDFAAVTAELDRLSKPREVPVPRAVPVVRDAMPVEPPRPHRARAEPLEEARPAPRPRRRHLKLAAKLLVVASLLLVVAFGAAWAMGWLGRAMVPPLGRPVVVDPPPSQRPQEVKPPPLAEEDFRKAGGVIEKLNDGPSEAWLVALAGRLGETRPTDAQRKRHAEYLAVKAAFDAKAGPKAKLDEAAKADDVLMVSRGLNRLTRSADLLAQKNAVAALRHWGTLENVDGLIVLTEATSYGADVVRIGACEALAKLPSQDGADAIAARLESGWPPERQGVTNALAEHVDPAKSEAAILRCLDGKVSNHEWPSGKRKPVTYDAGATAAAVGVLERIGTRASLPKLRSMQEDRRGGAAARKAVAAIEKRQPK